MKNQDINIRDPFILKEDGVYYLYGTRGKNFGQKTGGFDVYKGTDLENWSEPEMIFDSEKFGLNKNSNWAPEVHKFNGKYYMLATFEKPDGMRGTYSLVSASPDGEFVKCSENSLTPDGWWCLDGTLYISREGKPYLVFCHEHVQIMNGTVCYVELNSELSEAVSEPIYMFSGWDAKYAERIKGNRYVTDGPFMYRGKNNRLYMIWSSAINGQYYQCLAVSSNGEIDGTWEQLEPIFTKDGGHGMLFEDLNNDLKLTLHCPNSSLDERPVFFDIEDTGERLVIKE